MTRSRNRRVAAALASGCLVLAGCSQPQAPQTAAPERSSLPADEGSETTEPKTEAAVTSGPPPTSSAQEQDEADVEETLRQYTRSLNDAFNGDASIEGIYPFSRDTAREQWVTEVLAAEAQGITFSGVTRLEDVRVSVDGGTAEAVACADVTDVKAIDGDGDSIIAEDRLDKTEKEYVLERDESAEFGWYVVEDTNRNEPCNG